MGTNGVEFREVGWHMVKGEYAFVPDLPLLTKHQRYLLYRWDHMRMPAPVSDKLLRGRSVEELSIQDVRDILSESSVLQKDYAGWWRRNPIDFTEMPLGENGAPIFEPDSVEL